MKMRIARLILVGTVLFLFTACLKVGTSTSTRFYLLESSSDEALQSAFENKMPDVSIGVGPVTLAQYLDRPQLVSRLSGNELRVHEFSQWAEPLKATIARVVEENLSVLTGAKHIHSFPKRRSAVIDYQISLDVRRFDADAAGSVTLQAVWHIAKPEEHQRLMERRSVIVQPSSSTDSTDVVDAMSMALTELSKEITRALVIVAQK